jgi:hypothetical protein
VELASSEVSGSVSIDDFPFRFEVGSAPSGLGSAGTDASATGGWSSDATALLVLARLVFVAFGSTSPRSCMSDATALATTTLRARVEVAFGALVAGASAPTGAFVADVLRTRAGAGAASMGAGSTGVGSRAAWSTGVGSAASGSAAAAPEVSTGVSVAAAMKAAGISSTAGVNAAVSGAGGDPTAGAGVIGEKAAELSVGVTGSDPTGTGAAGPDEVVCGGVHAVSPLVGAACAGVCLGGGAVRASMISRKVGPPGSTSGVTSAVGSTRDAVPR